MEKRRRGEIKKISELFNSYKKRLRAPQGTVIVTFQEVVQDIVGTDIPKEQLAYTVGTRTLTIKGGGPRKSEILLYKQEILTHLKGRLGEKSAPRDII